MKLELTPQRLKANKENSKLGSQAWVAKCNANYESNPSYCTNCKEKLPRLKKNNKFCSRNCSATFNNTIKPKRIKKIKKTKECAYCKMPTTRIFCSIKCSAEGRRKYKSVNEANEIKRIRRNEVSANYRAKLRNQTPENADRKSIREFYANCPKGYEVDHIIPISKGGLHILENLQYLSISENRKKSNKLVGPQGFEP